MANAFGALTVSQAGLMARVAWLCSSLLGCGGVTESRPNRGPDVTALAGGGGAAGSAGGTGSSGGAAAAAGAATAAGSGGASTMNCGSVGDQRPAEPGEPGEYCSCHSSGEWRCYGRVPGSPPAGGDGTAAPTCGALSAQVPKEDASNCYLLWSDCDDGRSSYAVSCIAGECWCLVDQVPWRRLEPPRDCPADLESVNAVCGWLLNGQDPGQIH